MTCPIEIMTYIFCSIADLEFTEPRPTEARETHLLSPSLSMPELDRATAIDDEVDMDAAETRMTDLVELLIEIDHDMAIFEFALISSVSRRLRTESEADEVHVSPAYINFQP